MMTYHQLTLQQVASEEILGEAHAWLCARRKRFLAGCDVKLVGCVNRLYEQGGGGEARIREYVRRWL